MFLIVSYILYLKAYIKLITKPTKHKDFWGHMIAMGSFGTAGYFLHDVSQRQQNVSTVTAFA